MENKTDIPKEVMVVEEGEVVNEIIKSSDEINDSDVIEKPEIKKVLTYTPNYRAKLQDIQINKNYNIEETLKHDFDHIKQFYFKWIPEEGETTFDLNKNINIIDFNFNAIRGKDSYNRTYTVSMCIIDNYGNIYETIFNNYDGWNKDPRFKFDSIILKNKEQEILSDQVIDFIIDNNIIRKKNLSSDEIKKIQEIAGMGQEQTIKYVINRPQEIIEVKYDKNDILKDLLLSFPGCDPWDKSKELIEKYTTRISILLSSLDHDEDLFDELVYEKNNIKKMISRNIDIDDDDIQQLIENKKKILNRINNKINEIMDRSEDKNDEIEKLKVLLCKLENIPQKKMTTEFISTIE